VFFTFSLLFSTLFSLPPKHLLSINSLHSFHLHFSTPRIWQSSLVSLFPFLFNFIGEVEDTKFCSGFWLD
jgi:hypothetical protein